MNVIQDVVTKRLMNVAIIKHAILNVILIKIVRNLQRKIRIKKMNLSYLVVAKANVLFMKCAENIKSLVIIVI